MKYGNVEIYKYSELSDAAKQKARENFVENWMHHDWWDCTYDYMKEEGYKHGFHIHDIRFSGFWSQGDGASWCGRVDLKGWIEHSFTTTDQEHPLTQIFLALLDEGWIESKVMVSFSTSRYCHENTLHINEIDHYYRIDDDSVMERGMFKGASVADLVGMLSIKDGVLDTLYERLDAECKDFAQTIYRALEEDYEAQISEESVADIYEANGAMFGEGGNFLTLND